MAAKKRSVFRVVMSGGPVLWKHRQSPEFHDDAGFPRRVEKPALGRVTVAAGSPEEAERIARDMNREYHTVESVEEVPGA